MGEWISRFKSTVSKYGIIKTFKKSTLYLYCSLLDKFGIPKQKEKAIISKALSGSFDRIIIRRSPFGYKVPLFQRPQHLAQSLAKSGCLVFYNVSTVTDGVRYIKELRENLYLINLSGICLRRYLLNELKKINAPKYIEVYSTDRTTAPRDILNYKSKGFGIIYQYVDHIAPEISGTRRVPKNIIKSYNHVANDKDVFIVATADALYNDIASFRGNHRLILSTNGVDTSHFRKTDNCKAPSDLKNILDRGLPVLCYYGAIASWIDFELIRKIDATNEFSTVLIGVNYDGSLNRLKGLKNTFYLGHKSYSELKYYAGECDILVIPFKIGDISRSTSPVKLFEYMAIGRPIVCTDMDECRKYGSVLIGQGHEDFILKLQVALTLKNNEAYKAALFRDAEANDWKIKAKEIISLLLEGE